MRVYEILDSENEIFVGNLLYYDKKKDFIIELDESLNEWTAPLLFTKLVSEKIFRISRNLSAMWVRERVIPSGRQNISNILHNHKMTSYDEMKLLELADGKCSQDKMYIRKIDFIPQYIRERQKKNVDECVVIGQTSLLCFFADGEVKKIDLAGLTEIRMIDKVIKNDRLLQSCKVGTGGYSITFNDSIDIPCDLLYERGQAIPLSREDFLSFAASNIVDTQECCKILDTSRQNVAYLKRQGKLDVIKENVRGALFLKGDVIRNTW